MPKSHVVTIDLRGMAQAVTSSRKGEVSKEGALHRVVSISGARVGIRRAAAQHLRSARVAPRRAAGQHLRSARVATRRAAGQRSLISALITR